MIDNIADLKNRTLVESNIMKSFILAQSNGIRTPNRDDILIHDYQIANSVTINSILSNYVVNLKYAWDLLYNEDNSYTESYFQIVERLDEETQRLLKDSTRLILTVEDGEGTFNSRKLKYAVNDVGIDEGTRTFVNLETVWYGIVRTRVIGVDYCDSEGNPLENSDGKLVDKNGHLILNERGNRIDRDGNEILDAEGNPQKLEDFYYVKGSDGEYVYKDQLKIVEGMNDFDVNPNPYGTNPFDVKLTRTDQSFNGFMHQKRTTISRIVENLFYNNLIDEDTGDEVDWSVFGQVIPECRYIVCTKTRLYGLVIKKDGKKFDGFEVVDIGELIPNFDQDVYRADGYEFILCDFYVVSNVCTMFTVFKEVGSGEYHYVYFNDECYDTGYGFTEIDKVVIDQLIVDTEDAFGSVHDMRGLGNLTIAMTDYGFWDVEANTTNDITYSFKGPKTHERGTERNYTSQITKLITPVERYYENDSKVVDYDKIWKKHLKNGFNYFYNHYVGDGIMLNTSDKEHPGFAGASGIDPYPEYLATIVGTDGANHSFVGGLHDFAVYDGDLSGNNSVQILASITEEQFKQLLFCDKILVNVLIDYLYGYVVHPELGEWYLYTYHEEFNNAINPMVTDQTFAPYSYQVVSGDNLIGGAASDKFYSVKNLIGGDGTSLYTCCNKLWQTLHETGLSWLITGGLDSLTDVINTYFKTQEWKNIREPFVGNVLDKLIDTQDCHLLGYFRKYLEQHLLNDYYNCPDGEVTVPPEDQDKAVDAVQDYISDKVTASLVLGGYKNTGPVDNSRYPGIDSYIPQTQVKLNKLDVTDVFSHANVLKETVAAIQSMPFFHDYNTYSDLLGVVGTASEDNLFNISQDWQFLQHSGYVTTTGKLQVNWNSLRSWLFPETKQSEETLLKAFIKTQIYRHLFFNPNDYNNFTKNASAYQCHTARWYFDHTGERHPLVINGLPDNPSVDIGESELFNVPGKYSIEDVVYFPLVNKLQYKINYDTIRVRDNKFVNEDVEFYVINCNAGTDENPDMVVNSIYFNEFQKEIQAVCDQLMIYGNKFTLNNKEYEIKQDNDRKVLLLLVGSATEVWDQETEPKEQEFKCEIIKDDKGIERFKLDGIWYSLQIDPVTNTYTRLNYAGVDDTRLTQIYLTPDGIGMYEPWGLTFQFVKDMTTGDFLRDSDGNWNVLKIVKKHQSDIQNTVVDEWCVFDSKVVSIDPNQTYEWYLSNEIDRMSTAYPSQRDALNRLGGGQLYTGQLSTDCWLRVIHEIQDGDVVTKVVMVTKDLDGNENQKVLGALFDRNLKLSSGRVVKGRLDDDGLIVTDGTAQTFILKDVRGGLNNTNSVWMDSNIWETAWEICGIGNMMVDENDTTNTLTADWSDGQYGIPECLTLTPIAEIDSKTGADTGYVTGYLVTYMEDGSCQYTANIVDAEWVHVVARNSETGELERYRVNVLTNKIDKLLFREIRANTLDFGTNNTSTQLRDYLVANIKQYMMNEMVQTLVDSTYGKTSTVHTMSLTPEKALNRYLDLMSDSATLDNYLCAQMVEPLSVESLKFQEIYKNNLKEIDDSLVGQGSLYGYLKQKIVDTFGNLPGIGIVDKPALDVRREGVDPNYVDTFTYKIVLDLHLMQNKDLMKKLATSSEYFREHFIIGNAVVRDMNVEVKFTPKFNPSTGSMTYDVVYKVLSGTYTVEYGQVVYNYNGKTKNRTVSPSGKFSFTLASPLTLPKANKSLDELVDELVSNNLERLIPPSQVASLMVQINNSVPNGTMAFVENKITYNPKRNTYGIMEYDGPWELGTPIPTGQFDGNIVRTSRGFTMIDGELYKVSDDDSKLEQVDGANLYNIANVQTHRKKTVIYLYYYEQSGTVVTQGYVPKSFKSTSSTSELQSTFSMGQTFETYTEIASFLENICAISGSYSSKRDNFIIREHLYLPDELESIKIAMEDGVAEYNVEKNDGTEYKIGLTSDVLGNWFIPSYIDHDTRNERQVFLKYNSGYGFAITQIKDFTIDYSKFVNLDKYVKSISFYHPTNGYKEEYGFSGTRQYILIDDGQKTQNLSIGPGLQESSSFTYVLPDDVQAKMSGTETFDHEITFELTGKVETEREEEVDGKTTIVKSDNGWTGINGSFKAQLYRDVEGGEVKLKILSGSTFLIPCYQIPDVPDQRKGKNTTSIDIYTPIAGEVQYTSEENTVQTNENPSQEEVEPGSSGAGEEADDEEVSGEEDIVPEDGGDSEDSPEETGLNKTQITIIFPLSLEKKTMVLGLKPDVGKKYVSSGILVERTSASNISAQHVIELVDFDQNDVGELGYGYAQIPKNIQDVGDSHTGTSIEDYDWSGFLFISLNNSTSSVTFGSQGARKCPSKLEVLPPKQVYSGPGTIYDRVYEVEENVQLPIGKPIPESSISDGKFWMDKASVLKSIRTSENIYTWRKLMYSVHTPPRESDTTELADVPQALREQLIKVKDGKLKQDDNNFTLMLTQFQTFLSLIRKELTDTLDVNEIRSLCNFGYSTLVSFPTHAKADAKWKDITEGLFGYGRTSDTAWDESIIVNPTTGTTIRMLYQECLNSFQDHLRTEFFNDFSPLAKRTGIDVAFRDYNYILLDNVKWPKTTGITFTIKGSYDGIFNLREQILSDLYDLRNVPILDSDTDLIKEIFGDLHNEVRYINVVGTSVLGHIVGLFFADEYCQFFVKRNNASGASYIRWYKFSISRGHMDTLLDNKRLAGDLGYEFDPTLVQKELKLVDNNWMFKFMNRDLSRYETSEILDSFAVHFNTSNTDTTDLWYVYPVNGYVYSVSPLTIVDMAYEQYGDTLYVIFKDDNFVYRYDRVSKMKGYQDKILLQKESASMKIETFHSVYITDKPMEWNYIYIDYKDNFVSGSSTEVQEDNPKKWTIRLYGKLDGKIDIETWDGSPGTHAKHFLTYNNVMFGDSLFDESQLMFQNISKNKDMFDILDIGEVDGSYYGLFKNDSVGADGKTNKEKYGYDTYTVFKTASKYTDTNTGKVIPGVVQRLPYTIVDPHLYQTADSLYSLYVVERTDDGKIQLHEVSVPNTDLYADRVIPLYDILKTYAENPDNSFTIDLEDNLPIVTEMVMTKFKIKNSKTHFFVLSNKGFQKIYYENDFEHVSIDSKSALKDALEKTFKEIIVQDHMDRKHHGDQSDYFDTIAKKINQYADDFTVFSLIPTEFTETQDIGVIPDSKVDDTDKAVDHRPDSVQVSTDILWTDGMVADTDTNPGLITAAISNPATTYDSVYVFLKSQRNPSIEGTEFYDYITDSNGKELMDLYQIPFIYRINSNNTYDLYINVPTTRTKYLNRVAGTLKDDLTTLVLKDDTRTRRNFLDEAMANNMDESTTKLRIYIDKKYISIGNVELVEISGNSIPLQIYRDVPNNGLYDSIALESRWNGEVVEINDTEKDINKVMLEFECYGTDSQSIHIQGKTLINRALDDRKYKFG